MLAKIINKIFIRGVNDYDKIYERIKDLAKFSHYPYIILDEDYICRRNISLVIDNANKNDIKNIRNFINNVLIKELLNMKAVYTELNCWFLRPINGSTECVIQVLPNHKRKLKLKVTDYASNKLLK